MVHFLQKLIRQYQVSMLSFYLIVVLLGFITIYQQHNGDWLQAFSLMLSYNQAMLIVTALLLVFYSLKVALVYLLVMLSTITITSILYKLRVSELQLWIGSPEQVMTITILVAASTVLFVLVFTQQRDVIGLVGRYTLFSGGLFLLLYTTHSLPTDWLPILLFLVVGQGVAYCLSLLYLSWVTPSDSEASSNHEPLVNRLSASTQGHVQQAPLLSKATLVILLLLYALSVALCWYVLFNVGLELNWLLIFGFSFLIMVTTYLKLTTSFLLSLFLLFISLPMAIAYRASPLGMEWQIQLGLLLFMGVGSLLFFVWSFSMYRRRFTYLFACFLFLVSCLPYVLGEGIPLDLKWVLASLMLGYLIVHFIGIVYLPLFYQLFFIRRKRADRPYDGMPQPLEASLRQPLQDKGHQNLTNRIYIEQMERDLVLTYKGWLNRREMQILEDFSKKGD